MTMILPGAETAAWKFVKSGSDGQCELFGANIFKIDWKDMGKKAEVLDPLYGRMHAFPVYEVKIHGKIYCFAAGEFSNNIWGFYVPAE